MNLPILTTFAKEVEHELHELLQWWIIYTVDEENGGFYGKIDNYNVSIPHAPKSLVLNTRILYTFSSAYLSTKESAYLSMANRAFEYLNTHFLDTKNGGFYWSVTYTGEQLDGKKQIYGQAFAIYALVEYYKITANTKALSLAQGTFALIEKYSFDPIYLGYLEAFSIEWKSQEDLRLSDKDQNEQKSMNTHLHVIEAYANLYTVWPNDTLKAAISKLLANFKQHIIDQKTHHLHLFFTANWEVKSTITSFGHDIEAAWLLQEAAESIADETEIEIVKTIALQLSEATEKGLAKNGGLWYEYDTATQHWIKEMHWWPQAEAMVGFFNAFQLNGDEKYLKHSLQSWEFIKNYLKDIKNGEWYWGINDDYSLLQGEDKAGFWKCPYHNGRACLEIMKRIKLHSNHSI
ncbi:AGE family epimerase/isomerase [Pedobacter boryungensis]|uniref:Cellobiose 2-epimerase n=1 Tax=Pedobacter boryungensis TaxID=869962 RepID=A0ABX2DF70_9SPHI|nr:AGE family epimerase/isomerase [Pedobacter boryungensis]NQX32123.1 AGE family epimerase/isomerase [Pedobacter boryungensis]